MDIIYLVLTLLAVGVLSGLSAGMFGVGGGAVMVPALFFAFTALGISSEVVMHCAVATSTAVIVVNSIRSVRGHNRHKAVDWELLWPPNRLQSYAVWIGIGAFVAALWVAPYLSGQFLTLLFAVIIGVTSLQFIFGRPDWRLRDTVPKGVAPPFIGGTIGGLSSLLGIGGGSITVPLMSMCGMAMHRAIGTASGFGFAIAAPASLGFMLSGWAVSGRPPLSLGYVNVLGFICIAVVAYIFIPIGVKITHGLSQKKLKSIFGICLLFIALNMARKAVF